MRWIGHTPSKRNEEPGMQSQRAFQKRTFVGLCELREQE